MERWYAVEERERRSRVANVWSGTGSDYTKATGTGLDLVFLMR